VGGSGTSPNLLSDGATTGGAAPGISGMPAGMTASMASH